VQRKGQKNARRDTHNNCVTDSIQQKTTSWLSSREFPTSWWIGVPGLNSIHSLVGKLISWSPQHRELQWVTDWVHRPSILKECYRKRNEKQFFYFP
jgi:hypothetical protein